MAVHMHNAFHSFVKTVFIDTFLFIIEMLDMLSQLFLSAKEKEFRVKRSEPVAKRTDPNDPSSTYTTCEFPEPLKISDPSMNIFGEFEKFALEHPDIKTLGTRRVYATSDEIQSNGKIFKKFELGNYEWQTYAEAHKRLIDISNGLLAVGFRSNKNVILFSETRAEWLMSALSCFRIKVPVVTLYATLGVDALQYGIEQAECTQVITSSDQLPKFENIMSSIPSVTTIIVLANSVSVAEVNEFKKKFPKLQVLLLTEVEEIGKKTETSFISFETPKRDDLAVIMYTSGSTGNPKGVMISHGNLLASSISFPLRLGSITPNSDLYVAYLPLAHILELAAEIGCITHGIRLGYSSALTLVDSSTGIKKGQKGDLRVLKPTIMAAVPLILERFSKAVKDKISNASWLKQALFKRAYEIKKDAVLQGRKTVLLDKLVFSKINKLVHGGKLRFFLAGGAHLSEGVEEFVKVCLAPVRQAYALTETAAGGTGQYEFEIEPNTVGSNIATIEIRLINWEEGGYRITDKPNPRGEVYIGGDNVTMGYYKMPEKTAEDFHVIDGVRYFATGDIGEILPSGNLKIIDRKKDLVKLQGGEYVALSKVEVVLKLISYIDNCCMFANPLKTYPVCLICPNVEKIAAFAKYMNIANADDLKSQMNNAELAKAIQKEIEQHCLKQKLQRFEIPARVKLVEEIWMPDTGLVTDSFKLKRKALENFYKRQFESLYR